MSKLLVSLRAFLGDATAATECVTDAMRDAVTIMAQHGTRAPVDEAIKTIDALTGRSQREVALRAGLDAVRSAIKAVKPGKADSAQAAALADSIAEGFALACGAIVNAKAEKPPVDALALATKACKTLSGAKVTDKALARALASNEGRDMVARIDRIRAELAAKEATDSAKRAAKTATPGAKRTEAAPAPVAAVTA